MFFAFSSTLREKTRASYFSKGRFLCLSSLVNTPVAANMRGLFFNVRFEFIVDQRK